MEVWTPRGLIRHYVLFVISLIDRGVHIAGITTRPDEAWMLQVARNLTDEQGGALDQTLPDHRSRHEVLGTIPEGLG